MRTRWLPLLAIAASPTLLFAQRGGGGVGRKVPQADYSTMSGSMIKMSNRDLEDVSPLKLLIDKRKDLKLTDDQLSKIKDQENKLKESTKPGFEALDSLRRAATPSNRTPDDGDMARAGDARRRFAEVVSGIRAQYDGAAMEAVGLLDDTQKPTANQLLQKQHGDADDMVRDKLGGGPTGRP